MRSSQTPSLTHWAQSVERRRRRTCHPDVATGANSEVDQVNQYRADGSFVRLANTQALVCVAIPKGSALLRSSLDRSPMRRQTRGTGYAPLRERCILEFDKGLQTRVSNRKEVFRDLWYHGWRVSKVCRRASRPASECDENSDGNRSPKCHGRMR